MIKWQRDIHEFHVALDIETEFEHAQPQPAIRRPALRAELLREESNEAIQAILDGDLVEAVDGLIDTIVVALGAAVEFGVDLEPIWDEVHKTNMAKKGGAQREDGKRLKPDGWVPPDIERELMAQGWSPDHSAR